MAKLLLIVDAITFFITENPLVFITGGFLLINDRTIVCICMLEKCLLQEVLYKSDHTYLYPISAVVLCLIEGVIDPL